MDFSVILAQPTVRALVQENALDRFFADALFPNMLFRQEADVENWEAQQGDNKTFTGKGLMKPRLRPIYPGKDPVPHDYTFEQWMAQMQKYADTIDTQMPTALAAAVNKLTEDLKTLGLNAGQTINRLVRNRMYNAALSGWTNATTMVTSTAAVHVARLNGFTRARRPDLSTGSPVLFQPVSANNPLAITVNATAVNVTGFTPDTAGDEVGPGTLTLDAAVSCSARDAVYAGNRSYLVRVGGGNSIDSLSAGTDILHLADIRSAVARLRSMNVPEHADGSYHLHLDPTNEAQIYADNEFQRLHISLPESTPYLDFAITKMLGCIFYRNNETPQPSTVDGSSTDAFSQDDPFGGEVYTAGSAVSGIEVHRPIVTGGGSLKEYYVDQNALITEAGITGKVEVGARVINNGIEMDVQRIHVVLRSPQDRLQEIVAQTWKFQGDWVVRTDAATGDAASYKRQVVIETTI